MTLLGELLLDPVVAAGVGGGDRGEGRLLVALAEGDLLLVIAVGQRGNQVGVIGGGVGEVGGADVLAERGHVAGLDVEDGEAVAELLAQREGLLAHRLVVGRGEVDQVGRGDQGRLVLPLERGEAAGEALGTRRRAVIADRDHVAAPAAVAEVEADRVVELGRREGRPGRAEPVVGVDREGGRPGLAEAQLVLEEGADLGDLHAVGRALLGEADERGDRRRDLCHRGWQGRELFYVDAWGVVRGHGALSGQYSMTRNRVLLGSWAGPTLMVAWL